MSPGLSDAGEAVKFLDARDGVVLGSRAELGTAKVTGESGSLAKMRGVKLGVDAVMPHVVVCATKSEGIRGRYP